MDLKLYNEIISDYQKLKKKHLITNMREILRDLIEKFCNNEKYKKFKINEKMIISLISYKFQKEQMTINNIVNWEMVYSDYKQGVGSLLSIAATAEISPALVSQRIIKNFYSSIESSNKLKEYRLDSNMIIDYQLAFESMLANYSDPFYGIHNNQASINCGSVFEQKVEKYLKEANVDYMNENELRNKNYDVTPDFKLNIPIILERHWRITEEKNKTTKQKCIKNYLITKPIKILTLKSLNDTNSESILPKDEKNITREIINWVECKSLFANLSCHKEYIEKQYNSYVNRFGKGLIIYHFGYTENIIEEDNRFIVLDNLPEVK